MNVRALAVGLLLAAAMACAEAEHDVGPSGNAGGCSGSACGGQAGSAGATACAPGKQEACACRGNQQGVQICRDDGSGFLPCDCGSAGAGGSSGTGGSGGVAGSAGCSIGEKECSGLCVAGSPQNGCDAPGCTPCPVPTNGSALCTSGQCDVSCNAGYQKNGGLCEPGGGNCNPLAPQSSAGGFSPCPSGQTCVPSATGATSCVTSGGKGFEAPCSSHAECAPGLACAKEFIGGNHCIHYCLNTADCQGLYLCAGTFDPALYAGSQSLSYCL